MKFLDSGRQVTANGKDVRVDNSLTDTDIENLPDHTFTGNTGINYYMEYSCD